MISGLTYVPLSDIGVRREENQDYQGHDLTPQGVLFIVADGMGGHAGGATASQLTVNQTKRSFHAMNPDDPVQALKDSIQIANHTIRTIAAERPELRSMGSTIVALLIQENRAWIAHVGDSRIYLFRNNKLHMLTKDHTVVQRMVDSGEITYEQAEQHHQSHMLSRSLGGIDWVQVEARPTPIFLEEGDIFLLCSDGLTGLMEDAEIGRVLKHTELFQAARFMVDEVNCRGGFDNTTIGLVRVDKLPLEGLRVETSFPPPTPAELFADEVSANVDEMLAVEESPELDDGEETLSVDGDQASTDEGAEQDSSEPKEASEEKEATEAKSESKPESEPEEDPALDTDEVDSADQADTSASKEEETAENAPEEDEKAEKAAESDAEVTVEASSDTEKPSSEESDAKKEEALGAEEASQESEKEEEVEAELSPEVKKAEETKETEETEPKASEEEEAPEHLEEPPMDPEKSAQEDNAVGSYRITVIQPGNASFSYHRPSFPTLVEPVYEPPVSTQTMLLVLVLGVGVGLLLGLLVTQLISVVGAS